MRLLERLYYCLELLDVMRIGNAWVFFESLVDRASKSRGEAANQMEPRMLVPDKTEGKISSDHRHQPNFDYRGKFTWHGMLLNELEFGRTQIL